MSFSRKNLHDVEDMAAKHGFADLQEARFPRDDLNAAETGLAYLVLRPGKRQPFAHRHRAAEEIYVVLSGSGRAKLDDEIVELGDHGRHPGGPPVVTGPSRRVTRGSSCWRSAPPRRRRRAIQDFWADAAALRPPSS